MSPARLAAEQRAVERAQVDAERQVMIARLAATLEDLVTVHRDSWPAAQPPVIDRLVVVDQAAVVKHVRSVCLQGIGVLQRQQRREATQRADVLAVQYVQDENDRLERERVALQSQADAWWQQLLADDEDVVCGALNAAFADNPAGGAAVGVVGAVASVVIRQLDLSTMPTHRPDRTAAGRPTMKKMVQRDRHALFLDSLVSNVAATLREGFAVAPGLQSITVCALARFERTHRLGPVLLGRWDRRAVEAVQWGRDGDAHELVLDRHAEMHLDQSASGEAKQLSSRALPELEPLMTQLRDAGEEDEPVQPPPGSPLRPRSFQEWQQAQEAAGTGPAAPPAAPTPVGRQAERALRPGQVMGLQIGEFDAPVAFQVSVPDGEEVDLSVLLLDPDGRTRTDRDFVFCNAPVSPMGAVTLSAPGVAHGTRTQAVSVDIGDLRQEGVERLAVIVSSQVPLAGLSGLRVSLKSTHTAELSLPLPAEAGVTAAVVAELYLRRDQTGAEWRVRGLGQGWVEGLGGVLREYGVQVDG